MMSNEELRHKYSAFQHRISGGAQATAVISDEGAVAVMWVDDSDDEDILVKRSYLMGECASWRNIQAVCIDGGPGEEFVIGLKDDGTVCAYGNNSDGQCDVDDLKNIVMIAAGMQNAVGLKRDGTVVAAGQHKTGQNDVYGWRDIIAVSAGGKHTIGLKADGTVVAAGSNYYNESAVDDWEDIVAVSAGAFHTVGLKRDGTAIATGLNKHGQCEVTGWSGLIALSAGGMHTFGLKSDGSIVVATSDSGLFHEITNWTDIVALSAGSVHVVGLRADGTVLSIPGIDGIPRGGISLYCQKAQELYQGMRQQQQAMYRRELGLCPNCGGELSRFMRKCKVCGQSSR